MNTNVQGQPAPWTDAIRAIWEERVAPLFQEDETCSDANYFTPRPYRNEYDRGSKHEGFCYTVQPGNRVAIKEWIPLTSTD